MFTEQDYEAGLALLRAIQSSLRGLTAEQLDDVVIGLRALYSNFIARGFLDFLFEQALAGRTVVDLTSACQDLVRQIQWYRTTLATAPALPSVSALAAPSSSGSGSGSGAASRPAGAMPALPPVSVAAVMAAAAAATAAGSAAAGSGSGAKPPAPGPTAALGPTAMAGMAAPPGALSSGAASFGAASFGSPPAAAASFGASPFGSPPAAASLFGSPAAAASSSGASPFGAPAAAASSSGTSSAGAASSGGAAPSGARKQAPYCVTRYGAHLAIGFRHISTVAQLTTALGEFPYHVMRKAKSTRDVAFGSKGLTRKPVKKPTQRLRALRLTDEEVARLAHAFSVVQNEYDFQVSRGRGQASARLDELLRASATPSLRGEQWYLQAGSAWWRVTPRWLLAQIGRLDHAGLRDLVALVNIIVTTATSARMVDAARLQAITRVLHGTAVRLGDSSDAGLLDACLERVAASDWPAPVIALGRTAIAIAKVKVGHADAHRYATVTKPFDLDDASLWTHPSMNRFRARLAAVGVKVTGLRRPDVVALGIKDDAEYVREVVDAKFTYQYEGEGNAEGFGNNRERGDFFDAEQFAAFCSINHGDPPVVLTADVVNSYAIGVFGKGSPKLQLTAQQCAFCAFGSAAASSKAAAPAAPPAAPPNPILMQYAGINIRRSAYDSLLPFMYVEDDVLAMWYGHLAATTLADARLQLVAPALSYMIMNGAPAAARAQLGALIAGHRWIFLPINDNDDPDDEGGTHWTLLIFDRVTNGFHYFDTLNRADGLGLRMATRVQRLLRLINPTFTQHAAPQQHAPDCGVYVLSLTELIADALVRNVAIDFARIENPAQTRLRLRAFIAARVARPAAAAAAVAVAASTAAAGTATASAGTATASAGTATASAGTATASAGTASATAPSFPAAAAPSFPAAMAPSFPAAATTAAAAAAALRSSKPGDRYDSKHR